MAGGKVKSRKSFAAAVFLSLILCGAFCLRAAPPLTGKKVFIIDSYHEGYPWSDELVRSAEETLKAEGVECKVFRMDTKRNQSDEFARLAAEKAKAGIDAFKPDLIIAADDNASKYVLVPFYRNASIPCVFCGVNWDASVYGFPCSNITGMVEVAPVAELLNYLKKCGSGPGAGWITADNSTQRKEGGAYKNTLKLDLTACYVRSFAEWKKEFIELQKKCGSIIVGNNSGIPDWNDAGAVKFMRENTKVPTGTVYDFMMPLSVIGFVKQAAEQGEWAGETAVKILRGASPPSIPVERNSRGDLMINRPLAKKLGLEIPPEILGGAKKIIE
jgi:ABC-type uncharacterized transport system substrate-binding protein